VDTSGKDLYPGWISQANSLFAKPPNPRHQLLPTYHHEPHSSPPLLNVTALQVSLRNMRASRAQPPRPRSWRLPTTEAGRIRSYPSCRYSMIGGRRLPIVKSPDRLQPSLLDPTARREEKEADGEVSPVDRRKIFLVWKWNYRRTEDQGVVRAAG
jgi:hypothetical protein